MSLPPSYAIPVAAGLKASARGYKGHLRGLIQPAKAGFVTVAEGFSPAGGELPRTSYH